MFSGLVRDIGEVISFDSEILSLKSTLKAEVGDSIAVNGACLTVIKVFSGGFNMLLSTETSSLIAKENLKGKVHLEPALKLSDGLHGHIVQGHIDFSGRLDSITKHNKDTIFKISVSKKALPLIYPKGSITIDGISLTIGSVEDSYFSLILIPHTMENTLFHTYKVSRKVNIETDMIARSVYNVIKGMESSKNAKASQDDWLMKDLMTLGY
ncbi:riboflavin synthase subunit alpha [Helicobacter sp. 13S00401-1]|uniref:riboflavin synthase n=1 Tax=Helicobacter sp. 13S00401-1 TaxID=1905758 RepID=UPI000BA6375B|nr:riboflavin synthase [Helicobacter sp. 13S00401-1]PAF51877.1 riboflavin synthase subunit alpha [Helicobacter sp. 13S00401-1]